MYNLDPMVALLAAVFIFALAVLAFAASIAVLRWVFRINKIVSELEAMRKALERLMSQPPDSP